MCTIHQPERARRLTHHARPRACPAAAAEYKPFKRLWVRDHLSIEDARAAAAAQIAHDDAVRAQALEPTHAQWHHLAAHAEARRA